MVNGPLPPTQGERSVAVVNGPDQERPGERSRRTLDPELARMLARYRRQFRWSYRIAAREAGCSAGMVWYLEHGQRAPSVPLARSLARAYLMSLADEDCLLSAALLGVGRDWSPW